MAEPNKLFEIIPDEPPVKPKADPGAAMLLLGLKTLSQRAIAAVADLFTLATVGSAFWLLMSIKNPDPYQLIELAMYGAFILTINWIIRRRK